ncbi:hypothetical protein [Glycomyces tenuis]|uniref:hypothetical protein n=1 Tax=Glycomyces tenuis TaxID=58116 RepID=UPI00041ADDCA|nr:hypothetical protein [Glycomyces tenuis]
METTITRARAAWARVAVVVAGALLLIGLAPSAPVSAEAPAAEESDEIQIEAVESDRPVTFEDLGDVDMSASTTFYHCSVRDGRYGCTGEPPEEGLVVARLYQRSDFNKYQAGWMIVITNPEYEYGCSAGYGDDEGGANLPGGFINDVSSVQTYNHCDVKLGDAATGDASAWIDQDRLLGALNNRADAFKIS